MNSDHRRRVPGSPLPVGIVACIFLLLGYVSAHYANLKHGNAYWPDGDVAEMREYYILNDVSIVLFWPIVKIDESIRGKEYVLAQ